MASLQERIEQFLYKEAAYCDARNWDAYLGLYDKDCEYYIPQWLSETEITTDPKTQLAYIYYRDRGGLEDRVFRLRSGRSAAAQPPFRTAHMISNIRPEEAPGNACRVQANWTTYFYRGGDTGVFFGWSDYLLKPDGESWKIARKHVVILNDRINHVIDFYHV